MSGGLEFNVAFHYLEVMLVFFRCPLYCTSGYHSIYDIYFKIPIQGTDRQGAVIYMVRPASRTAPYAAGTKDIGKKGIRLFWLSSAAVWSATW